MKKVFNKVIAVAATVPLALTQGFAVLSNAADATTISVERVLEIKPQELESDWAKLVEGALIDSEGKSFELNVADIIDSADFSDKNAAYVEKVQKCIVGNPSVSIQNSVAVMTAQVDATSYVQSNIIDAIKKELTKQGAASIIDDIDFSMLEKIKPHFHLVENARAAIRKAGLEPLQTPIRGGTDGATLSYMGLPCPNLGTGGFNYHGPCEGITVEAMDKATEILLNLADIYKDVQ